jgi:Mur ligase-like protein
MPHTVEHFASIFPFLMQLKTLIAAIAPRQIIGPLDRTVEGIAYDSRRVQKDNLFVALRGEKSDGHQFIGQAIDRGASAIVAEREEKHARVTSVVVENTRAALADLAAAFYERPTRRLKMAGVTGTNGKTTTTFSSTFAKRPGCAAASSARFATKSVNAFFLPFAPRPSHWKCRSCLLRSRLPDAKLRRWRFLRTHSRRRGRGDWNGT